MEKASKNPRTNGPDVDLLPGVDLLVVGGGINGAGIARDAAGRGLSVLLVERDDLAAHTSSASTKLIHGGLRYLEYHEFRLVREALKERERLQRIAPHIVTPLRFILPTGPGGRPGWMIRLGLLLYDRIGGRQSLPRSAAVALTPEGWGAGLKPTLTSGFAYSDCRVDDARLVVLNAMDAAARGADIRTRTAFVAARRQDGGWIATIEDGATGKQETVHARMIVNAAGPWVESVGGTTGARPGAHVRLIKGSHIVVPRIHPGDHAYLFQNPDGRIVFVIPWQDDWSMIGTTDVPVTGDPGTPVIDEAETAYLCTAASQWLARPITPADIVSSWSGVRALHDDGASEAKAITRDYVLELDAASGEAPLLSVHGGKITTYRRLAEHALAKLDFGLGLPWTGDTSLPGGDFPDFADFLTGFRARWPFLPDATATRLARSYGTLADQWLAGATSLADLGEEYGAGLSEREVSYLIAREWARTADDIVLRRTKIGLRIDAAGRARLAARMERI